MQAQFIQSIEVLLEWLNIEKLKAQADIVRLLLDIYSKLDSSRMRMKWPGHRASVLSQSTWVIREPQCSMCVAADSEGCIPAGRCGGWRHSLATAVELHTKVSEDFTITEKAPSRAFSWLKAPTSAFTFNPNSEGVPATHLSEGGADSAPPW